MMMMTMTTTTTTTGSLASSLFQLTKLKSKQLFARECTITITKCYRRSLSTQKFPLNVLTFNLLSIHATKSPCASPPPFHSSYKLFVIENQFIL